MSLGPFDLTGKPFLILYIALLVATFIAGLIIPRRMRPEGRTQRVKDVDQLAYLAGGASRFGEAVVTRLLAARALTMSGRRSFLPLSRERGSSALERSILALPSPIGWGEIAKLLKSYREPLEQKMTATGLLMSKEEAGNIRYWVLLPYLTLLVFGATKWVIGDLRDRPVGYLTGLLVLTAILAILRAVSIDRRTQAGRDAVAKAKSEARRLRIAPTGAETDLAVALFGTTVLAGSAWSDFHRLRQAGDGSGGSCSSDGGGGGGCGGGGCGGCGS